MYTVHMYSRLRSVYRRERAVGRGYPTEGCRDVFVSYTPTPWSNRYLGWEFLDSAHIEVRTLSRVRKRALKLAREFASTFLTTVSISKLQQQSSITKTC